VLVVVVSVHPLVLPARRVKRSGLHALELHCEAGPDFLQSSLLPILVLWENVPARRAERRKSVNSAAREALFPVAGRAKRRVLSDTVVVKCVQHEARNHKLITEHYACS
jgi:hypothetical protein